MSDQQVIFSMVKVGKIVEPNNRQILRDISLGFYYGAKIGVLGLNGAGKSTLLRIIAGKDQRAGGLFTRLFGRHAGPGTGIGPG
jgi:energy-dependent translational throttle protein EttA